MTKVIEVNLPLISGGLVKDQAEYEIADNQSPAMDNMYFDGKDIRLRAGQEYLIQSTTSTPITSMYNWNDILICQESTKIYKYENNVKSEIYNGLSSDSGKFFEFNDKLFFKNGKEYISIDSEFNIETVAGYIPTIVVNATPDYKIADTNEAINYLTSGFKARYTSDGNSHIYKLPMSQLPLKTGSTIKVKVDSKMVSNYTIDYTLNKLTFDSVGLPDDYSVYLNGSKTKAYTIAGSVLTFTDDIVNTDAIIVLAIGELFSAYTLDYAANKLTFNSVVPLAFKIYKNGVLFFNYKLKNKVITFLSDITDTDIIKIITTGIDLTNYTTDLINGTATFPALAVSSIDDLKVYIDGVVTSLFTASGNVLTFTGTITTANKITMKSRNVLLDNYTMDYDTKKATFWNCPDKGINNVEITAYSADETGRNFIVNCKYVDVYGGLTDGLDGGTRVFMAGNADTPAQYYQSGIRNPEYFPDNVGDTLGNTSTAIVGMLKAYGVLMLFKTDSLHVLEYTVNANNIPQFVHREINGRIGCDIPSSIQLVNNIPIFANTNDGVYVVASTSLYEEKNVLPISLNINADLLLEANLQDAISVDYEGKYWLCVNGRVYLYDYTYSPYNPALDIFTAQRKVSWFKYSNINPNCFASYKDALIYSNKTDNSVVIFNPSKWYDFIETNIINGFWQSKAFNFGSHTQLKNITNLWIVANTQRSTSFTVEYLDEYGNVIDNIVCDKDVFSWSNFSWHSFGFNISRFATDFNKRPRIRRVRYFSIKITNNSPYQDVAISNVKIQAELLDNDRRR